MKLTIAVRLHGEHQYHEPGRGRNDYYNLPVGRLDNLDLLATVDGLGEAFPKILGASEASDQNNRLPR